MEVIKTAIEGVVIIEPKIFGDERGYFFESFNAAEFARKVGVNTVFVQDNESKSKYGVLRGLHFQKGEFAQSKLVRVVEGRVIDVAVIRQTRSRRTVEGEQTPTVHPARVRPRIRRIERGGGIPIQMRQPLRTRP